MIWYFLAGIIIGAVSAKDSGIAYTSFSLAGYLVVMALIWPFLLWTAIRKYLR